MKLSILIENYYLPINISTVRRPSNDTYHGRQKYMPDTQNVGTYSLSYTPTTIDVEHEESDFTKGSVGPPELGAGHGGETYDVQPKSTSIGDPADTFSDRLNANLNDETIGPFGSDNKLGRDKKHPWRNIPRPTTAS